MRSERAVYAQSQSQDGMINAGNCGDLGKGHYHLVCTTLINEGHSEIRVYGDRITSAVALWPQGLPYWMKERCEMMLSGKLWIRKAMLLHGKVLLEGRSHQRKLLWLLPGKCGVCIIFMAGLRAAGGCGVIFDSIWHPACTVLCKLPGFCNV